MTKRSLYTCLLFLVLLTSFGRTPKLREGWYRGLLMLDSISGTELPFTFEIRDRKKNPRIIIYNADEKIVVDEIRKRDDSLYWKMPAFDTEFKTRITASGLQGVWINHYRSSKNIVPFRAVYGESTRFTETRSQHFENLGGRWEVTFAPGKPDSSKAIGLFRHLEGSSTVFATFRTETGDYRYLEGKADGKKLMLSSFSGSSAYLFIATLNEQGELQGQFWSGRHFQQEWTARKNPGFELRDPNAITKFDNSKAVSFSFPDHKGKMISLDDSSYLGKPVIVQLMGTWCANCMDESRYLNELYRLYSNKGLRIIGLAYEKTPQPEKIPALIERYIQRLNLAYDILLTSRSGKQKATGNIPQLKEVSAFPTTLFLDRQHRIVRVHTGFNGPATGEAYQQFREETESLIRQLISQ